MTSRSLSVNRFRLFPLERWLVWHVALPSASPSFVQHSQLGFQPCLSSQALFFSSWELVSLPVPSAPFPDTISSSSKSASCGKMSSFIRTQFSLTNCLLSVGSDVGETGDGPGSFDVRGVLWHFPYGNPENKQSARFWALANALVGWYGTIYDHFVRLAILTPSSVRYRQNTATYQSIIGYVAYWWAAIGTLVYLKWAEVSIHFCL